MPNQNQSGCRRPSGVSAPRVGIDYTGCVCWKPLLGYRRSAMGVSVRPRPPVRPSGGQPKQQGGQVSCPGFSFIVADLSSV